VSQDRWLDVIKWDEKGLIPAISQEAETGKILMVAWMNREALELSVKEGRAIFWSRSRQKIWRKGEESGYIQTIHDIRLDCDNDVILLEVEQQGMIACHTGRQSCFFQRLIDGEWQKVEPVLRDPETIYSGS